MVRPFNVILSGTCLPEAEVQLPGSSSKVPNAVLMPNTLGDYPLVAQEVGLYPREELIANREGLCDTLLLSNIDCMIRWSIGGRRYCLSKVSRLVRGSLTV